MRAGAPERLVRAGKITGTRQEEYHGLQIRNHTKMNGVQLWRSEAFSEDSMKRGRQRRGDRLKTCQVMSDKEDKFKLDVWKKTWTTSCPVKREAPNKIDVIGLHSIGGRSCLCLHRDQYWHLNELDQTVDISCPIETSVWTLNSCILNLQDQPDVLLMVYTRFIIQRTASAPSTWPLLGLFVQTSGQGT